MAEQNGIEIVICLPDEILSLSCSHPCWLAGAHRLKPNPSTNILTKRCLWLLPDHSSIPSRGPSCNEPSTTDPNTLWPVHLYKVPFLPSPFTRVHPRILSSSTRKSSEIPSDTLSFSTFPKVYESSFQKAPSLSAFYFLQWILPSPYLCTLGLYALWCFQRPIESIVQSTLNPYLLNY